MDTTGEVVAIVLIILLLMWLGFAGIVMVIGYPNGSNKTVITTTGDPVLLVPFGTDTLRVVVEEKWVMIKRIDPEPWSE